MKQLIKPILLRRIKIVKKPKANDEACLQLLNRNSMNSSLDQRLPHSNVSQYINFMRNLDLDDTLNETLQRSMKLQQDKSSTELNKSISSIRLGIRNAKSKPMSISLTKTKDNYNNNVDVNMNDNDDLIENKAQIDNEEEYQSQLKSMKNSIKEIKAKMKINANTINDLTNKIEDNNLNYDIAKQIKRDIRNMFFSFSAVKQHCPNIPKDILSKINQSKTEDIKEQIDSNKADFMNRITQLKIEQTQCKERINDLKGKIKRLQGVLSDYYHNILYQGIDFRQEGLSDFIKLIWNLDQEVNNEFFPSYLDQKSISYLYNIAHISFELNDYKNQMAIRRESQSKKVKSIKDLFAATQSKPKPNANPNPNSLNKSQSDQTFFTNNCYRSMDKPSPNYNSNFNFNRFAKLTKKKDKTIYPKIHEVMKEMSQEENQIEVYEEQIQKIKERELERITKEFLYNDYDRKFNVCIETMMSALFGKANKERNVSYYYNTKKALEEKIKGCQFYYSYNDIKKRKQIVNSNINFG